MARVHIVACRLVEAQCAVVHSGCRPTCPVTGSDARALLEYSLHSMGGKKVYVWAEHIVCGLTMTCQESNPGCVEALQLKI